MRSFDASAAHKGLWLAEKMSSGTLNHALTMWDVEGELDAATLESALLDVLNDAEVWRVNFVDDGNGLRMVPRELGDWRPFMLDLSAESEPEQTAREVLADLVKQPFDVERDLLFRLGVVKLGAARSLLVIAYHHLISDGFGAAGILSRRLAEVYTALVRGEKVPELTEAWDVESFAAAAAEYAGSDRFTEDTRFWRDYLADAPPPAQVPRVALADAALAALAEPISDVDRWAEVSAAIGMVSRTLTVPRAEADAWNEAATSLGVWLSSMLTAAAAVYFRLRVDCPEFVLSLAVANRSGAASKSPGLAVNVVPVRMRVPLTAGFKDVADAAVDEMYRIFSHTNCHYSDIQRASGAVLNGRGSFGAVLNIVEFADQLDLAGSPARHLGGTTGAFSELSIGVYTDGSADSDLFVRLDAPADLYSREELRFIGEELIGYVRAAIATDEERPVGALEVLSSGEYERVLQLSGTAAAPAPGLTIAELFDQQVRQSPDAVAVVSAGTEVTYRELDTRSSRLADALRRRGVQAETVVAVAMPRSVELAAVLLAVARAGGVYLPIDPASPAELVSAVAGGVSVHLLLADAATAGALPADLGIPVTTVEDLRSEHDHDGNSGGAPAAPGQTHPDSLLAVLYSAGSGGAVTGVGVTHGNVARLVRDGHMRRAGRDAVLWHSPINSDLLVCELWLPLLSGGRAAVVPTGTLDAETLTELATAHRVAAAWLPTGLFSTIAAQRPHGVAGLREVWAVGDRVPAAAVRRIRAACPDLTIVTGYGRAEVTVLAAAHGPAQDDLGYRPGSVGRPLAGTALFVLGPGLQPVRPGVAGELYVAGSVVARGYPGRPGSTAHRFVPCPFGPAGSVMYRTGDRARWATDGLLTYLGPAGGQAPVRGVWVELAEIEEVLSEHPQVVQSSVVVRDDNGQRTLVAYVSAADGSGGKGTSARRAGLSAEELRRFATGRLPESMVPAAFVMLSRLPVTAAGRTDRASLPEPDSGHGRPRGPRNPTEQILARAFAEVLELDRVGIDEDFFDLGGNSLKAIRLVGLIRAELKREVSIRTLFAVRTVAGLFAMLDDLAGSSRPALRRRTNAGEIV
ncbi:AMP-binding protein [Actinoplanes palleronii]|uniref:Carrier domain-containing protein n=1 Tax=Actinoplanes palleronii TaxID=113570 RepID=A0ABQ4BIY6_9ACTN|nr:AMP-binding protein [Actinoplanes palleronii]GIE70636.1 hypothetical protein Apa02nite_067440 [Actinoplanes palleronii]